MRANTTLPSVANEEVSSLQEVYASRFTALRKAWHWLNLMSEADVMVVKLLQIQFLLKRVSLFLLSLQLMFL